jgi:membrane-bound lytic murein transglycosylase D
MKDKARSVTPFTDAPSNKRLPSLKGHTFLTKIETIRTSCFILLFLVLPGLVYAVAETDECVAPDKRADIKDSALQMGPEAITWDQPQTEQNVMCLAPGYGKQIIPGLLRDLSTEAGQTACHKRDDGPLLSPEIQAIADRLAKENEEEPIQDAFVHGPEDLDDLAVPVRFKDAVDHYIAFFTIKKRKMFASWLRRANLYAPLLRKILRNHDLPEDLVYLAMIESGFNPKAYSSANACGPWQFISATGQRYGLRIDHWVDERRDFEKATVAAAQYLKDLFDRFGCWYLAASGYNAGEGRVDRAIRRHRTSDYWELYRYNTLPRETREYIPQLIAAANIAENPEQYGFWDIGPEEPFAHSTRTVPGGTPLRLVAKASSSDLSEIRSLNPELLTRITPPGEKQYIVRLPEDAPLELFDEKLKSQLKGKRVIGTVRLAGKRQRSLLKLLKRYGATRDDLALVNTGNLRASRTNPLYIPLFDKRRVAAEEKTTARLTGYRTTSAQSAVNAQDSGRSRAKFRRSSKGKPPGLKKPTKKNGRKQITHRRTKTKIVHARLTTGNTGRAKLRTARGSTITRRLQASR